MTDPEDVNLWTSRIEAASEAWEESEKKGDWKKILDAYKGKYLESEPDEDVVIVNWVAAYAQRMLPNLYYCQPEVMARSEQTAYELSAQYAAYITNYQLRHMRFALMYRRAVFNALLLGHSWFKLGWFTRFGQVPLKEGEETRKEVQEEKWRETGKQPRKIKDPADRGIYMIERSAFGLPIAYDQILVDPRATCPEEIRWIAEIQFRPLGYLQDDPYVENKDEIQPTFRLAEGRRIRRTRKQVSHKGTDPDLDTVMMYEIWDLDSMTTRWLAKGSKKWQKRAPHPYPYINRLPFYMLRLNEATDELYPPSPISIWVDQVKELSTIRTRQLDSLARMVRKIISEVGAFSETEKEKLLDPECDVVEISHIGAFKEFTALQPDAAMFQCESRVRDDIMDLSGMSELSLGKVPSGRPPATAIVAAESNSGARTKRMADVVKETAIEIVTDLFKITAKRQPYPQQVMLTTQMGIQWKDIDANDLDGRFLFDFDINEMSPISRQAQQKEAIDLYSVLSQAPEVKRRILLSRVVRAWGIDPDSILWEDQGPALDPSYENLMLAQAQMVQPNPKETAQIHLQVHVAFTKTAEYAQIIQVLPVVAQMMSSHLQATIALAAEQAKAMGSAGQPGQPGRSTRGTNFQTLQAGLPLMGSQPPGTMAGA